MTVTLSYVKQQAASASQKKMVTPGKGLTQAGLMEMGDYVE